MPRAALAVLSLLAWLPLAGPPALAQPPPPAAAVDDDEVEEATPTVTAAPAAPARLGALELVGRVHPLLVHFPIAWLILLAMIDAVALLLRRPGWDRVGWPLLALTVASFVAAAVTGLIRGGHVLAGASAELSARVLLHRNSALATAGVVLLALALRTWRRNRLAGAARLVYLVLLAAALGLVGLTGHLGGELSLGEGYLPF